MCPNCNALQTIPDRALDGYFWHTSKPCPSCGSPIDWWVAFRRLLEGGSSFSMFSAVRAHQTVVQTGLRRGEILELDFEQLGLPKNARLLHINYTPNGHGLAPVEMHGNEPQRYQIPRRVSLYPVPKAGAETNEVPLAILYTWVETAVDDVAWDSLVDAFEAFSSGRFSALVVPANVAVESRVSRVLHKFLCKTVPVNRVEDFLRSAATYSYQFNVLLPVLVDAFGAPHMPDDLRGHLNHLRKTRNDLAHRGRFDKPLSVGDAANLLCAAVFGFEYCQIVGEVLEVSGVPKAARGPA
jgi:hypothetical protein